MLLLITLLGYVITPYIIEPLRELSIAAERFGKGQFDTRSSVNSGDEIEELSNRFNQMARQIQKLVENLSSAGEFHRLFPYIIVPRKLYVKIVRQIRSSVGAQYVGLLLEPDDIRSSSPVLFSEGPDGLSASRISTINRDLLDKIADVSNQSDVNPLVQRSQQAQELSELFPGVDQGKFADALVFKLKRHDKIGYLILARRDHDFPDSEIQITNSLLPQIETVISNAQDFEDVLVDERTGLYPRKVMNLALKEAGQFANLENLWFSQLQVDIDKADQLKQDPHLEIARFLDNKRETFSPLEDTNHFFIISHATSGQFLAIVSGWSENGVREIFENIVQDISNSEGSEVEITAYAGLVSVRENDSTNSLLNRCDEALEKAKQQGGTSVWTET
jgi:HAMP domain-containing protein/GGDEF domain-containing protein